MTRRTIALAAAALVAVAAAGASAAPRRDAERAQAQPQARAWNQAQAEQQTRVRHHRAAARATARRHEALVRRDPGADPRSPSFYAGSPAMADWVQDLCRRPYGARPSAATCAAAGTGGSWR